MLKSQFNVLAAASLFASSFVTWSPAMAQTGNVGSLIPLETESSNQTHSAFVVSSSKSVGLSSKPSSLQTDAAQSSQQRLRFNVTSYTGKLGQAEQIFAASKVEPLFTNTAIIVPNTQREQLDPQDPNIALNWEDRVYTWGAPGFYHKPLYFQQVNLERYGIGPRPILQPAHSMMHFYGSIVLWPATMIWNRPAECTYTLGHQRPGDCVNYQRLSTE